MTGPGNSRWFRCLVLLAPAAVMLFLASAAVAQNEAQRAGGRTSNALSQAPEKARALHNPVEHEPDSVAAGGKLFEQHCSECHGKKAGGTRRGPSLLGRSVQQAPPGAIFWVLSSGVVRRGMPVWSRLPEPQRWQIVAFLKSLVPAEARAPGSVKTALPGTAR